MINQSNKAKFQSIVTLLKSIVVTEHISLSALQKMFSVRSNFPIDDFISLSDGTFFNDGLDYIIPINEVIAYLEEVLYSLDTKGNKPEKKIEYTSGEVGEDLLSLYDLDEIYNILKEIFGEDLSIESAPFKPSHYLPHFQMLAGIENTLKDFTSFLVGTGLFSKVGHNYRYMFPSSLIDVVNNIPDEVLF